MKPALIFLPVVAVVGLACGHRAAPSAPTAVGDNLSLDVYVTAASGPIAGIEVGLLRSSNREAVASKRTDQAGRAMFSDLGAGVYIVNVGYTFGLFAPERTVNVTSSATLEFPLLPSDDLVIDCIQADGGPCIPDGGTATYPSELTVSGRWSLATIPLTGDLVPQAVVGLERGPTTGSADGSLFRPGGNFQLARSQSTWSVRFNNYGPCTCDPREGVACFSTVAPIMYPYICSATTTRVSSALWQCSVTTGSCSVIAAQRLRDFVINWTRSSPAR